MTKKQSNPVTFADLEARHIDCEARLVQMKDEQASNILQGRTYDSAAIVAAQGELEAIQRAQRALSEQHEREAAIEAQRIADLTDAERRAAIALHIETIAAVRLDAIKEMEASARAFGSAFAQARKASDELFFALQSEGVNSGGLIGRAFEVRIGNSLSAVLSRATGGKGLGDMKFHAGLADAGASWLDAEAAVGRDVEAVISALSNDVPESQAVV